MARTVTLSSLRTQVRQRTDMVGSTFISDAELDGYINNSIAEFNDLINTSYGDSYNLTSTTLTTVAGTDTYSLPADFYKLVGGPRVLQSGTLYAPMQRFSMADIDRSEQSGWTTYGGSTDGRYMLMGSGQIKFLPPPSAVHSVKLYYVAAAAVLTSADTIDGVNGWEEYVIVDAAIKCLQKEESDVRVLMQQKDRLEQRIIANAANRDAAQGGVVRDVTDLDLDAFGWWP